MIFDWTIFGYYGGVTHNLRGFLYQTWYTVDDFGDLVESVLIFGADVIPKVALRDLPLT